MPKKFRVISIFVLLIVFLTGCSAPLHSGCLSNDSTSKTVDNDVDSNVGIPYPLDLYFSSGAGAWYTSITINSDGSFTGSHHDSDMGDTSEDYPNGTVYQCDFEGKFINVRQINAYTYSLTLDSITTNRKKGDTYIEDGVRFKASYPLGLMANDAGSKPAKEFLLYTPSAPVNEMPETWAYWKPPKLVDESLDTLSVYGLYNKEREDWFFPWS